MTLQKGKSVWSTVSPIVTAGAEHTMTCPYHSEPLGCDDFVSGVEELLVQY